MTTFLRTYHLSLRKPLNLERSRGEAASDPFVIYEFYGLVECEIQRLDLSKSPEKIWNLDETAFFMDPRGGRVVAPKGSDVHRVISGTGRSCFTALACVSTSGSATAPMVIFSGKNLQSTWLGQKVLSNTRYAVSGK